MLLLSHTYIKEFDDNKIINCLMNIKKAFEKQKYLIRKEIFNLKRSECFIYYSLDFINYKKTKIDAILDDYETIGILRNNKQITNFCCDLKLDSRHIDILIKYYLKEEVFT
jgi:hypothetical protein